MVKLLEYLSVTALVITVVGFGVWNYLFYDSPARPDAVNSERASIYMSTSNKTVVVYMSPQKQRVYDAIGNTFAISFVAFFALMLTAGWLKRKQNRRAQ